MGKRSKGLKEAARAQSGWQSNFQRMGTSAAGPQAQLSFRRNVEAFTKELYRDVSGEAEFIVGAESGRVYEYILTLKGPNLSGELSLMFDYDSQVEIPTPR